MSKFGPSSWWPCLSSASSPRAANSGTGPSCRPLPAGHTAAGPGVRGQGGRHRPVRRGVQRGDLRPGRTIAGVLAAHGFHTLPAAAGLITLHGHRWRLLRDARRRRRRAHPQHRRGDPRGGRLGIVRGSDRPVERAPSLERWLPVGASIGLTNRPRCADAHGRGGGADRLRGGDAGGQPDHAPARIGPTATPRRWRTQARTAKGRQPRRAATPSHVDRHAAHGLGW